jgi:hypothetical protein
MLPELIPDERLTLDCIPSDGASDDEILKFAFTFNGYEHHGSFEACAKIANARRQESLSDLRTCLFFEQGRWRHFGQDSDDESKQYFRSLVSQIRQRIGQRSRDL